ncbi:MAG: DUF1963 domain-containing protein [Planctomycetes bacterium]|nr:DUF1963 domain-containing protein [Planctomycetota bacterium]
MDESVKAFLAAEIPLIADSVATHVRPCIIGHSDRFSENEISVGSSKFCGRPDVPDAFEWPMTDDGPCWFLGQIDLAECTRFDPGVEIPNTGVVSFFYHDAGGPAGTQSRMLYFPHAKLHRIEVVPDWRWGSDFHSRHLFPRSLVLTQGHCLPGVDDLGLSPEEAAQYDDLEDFIAAFNDTFADGTHQFFGVPRYMWQSVPRRHQLIANFGECNDRIIYLIPEPDVASLRDSQLRVLYECT